MNKFLIDGGFHTVAPEPANAFPCTLCDKSYDDHSSRLQHMYGAHGQRRIARRHVSGSTCGCCMKIFSNRTGLFDHLDRWKPQCLLALVKRGPSITEEEALEQDRLESIGAKQRKHDGLYRNSSTAPVEQAYGPLIEEAYQTVNMTKADCRASVGRPVPSQGPPREAASSGGPPPPRCTHRRRVAGRRRQLLETRHQKQ